MKKTILTSVLAALCLFSRADAQDSPKIQALKIGDQIPDIMVNNLINYHTSAGKPGSSAKLTDFRNKVLILDFWATWCAPCVAMIPRTDSLQKEFAGKVQILPVTYQKSKEVTAFLTKYHAQRQLANHFMTATDDTQLGSLFPHVYLPHYVWIDGQGTVRGITGHEAVTRANIEKFLQTQISLPEKKDTYRDYDLKKSLRANLPTESEQALFSSTLLPYTEGLTSMTSISSDSIAGKRILALNVPLILLYRTAYADKGLLGRSRIRIESKDSTELEARLKGRRYLDWLANGNGYSYELKVSPAAAPRIYELMREELARLIPRYQAVLEKRQVAVYALKRTSATDKIRTKGEPYAASFGANGASLRNTYLIQFLSELNGTYMQNSKIPVIDLTGYTGKVDLDLDANLTDVGSVNTALAAYDLQLVRSVEPVEILVIRDNPLFIDPIKP